MVVAFRRRKMVEAIMEGGEARRQLMEARGQQQDSSQGSEQAQQAAGQRTAAEQHEGEKGERVAAVVQQLIVQRKGAASTDGDAAVDGPERPSVDLWAPRFR
jgi:hypothetical protein